MERAGLGVRRYAGEAVPLVFLALLAAAFLAPALAHGASLGPYDVLRELGLTSTPSPQVHNAVGSDEIEQFIPWQVLDWRQVHAGQLPLWNPDSLLGMPLAFNFEAAPFALPVAVSYLFPLRLAHSVVVLVTLLLGGSGAYVYARVSGLERLAATFGASVFELAGAFTIWLGVYQAGALCWTGWALAGATSLLRSRRAAVPFAMLAISLALSLVAGEPQIAALLIGFVTIYVLVLLGGQRRGASEARVGSGLVRYALAVLAGFALASPVYLPGIQLSLSSARSTGPYVSGLPPSDLTHLLFSDYNGVPTALGEVIGPNNLYVSMIYVGAIALVLGLVAVVAMRRRREVVALSILSLLIGIVLFVPPVASLMRRVVLLKVFRIDLGTTLLDFALAMLAAFGTEALLGGERRLVDQVMAIGTALVAATLLALGIALALDVERLPAGEASLRAGSFLWPALSCGACAAFVLGRMLVSSPAVHRRRAAFAPRRLERAGVVMLLGVEVAFLLVGGSSFVSSSPGFLAQNRAVETLRRIVGSSLVGIGSCSENAFPNAGILPNANAAYDVEELTAYDPMIPKSYYLAYGQAAGTGTAVLFPHVLCPAITSLSLARLFGVSYVLEPPGSEGPPGMGLQARLHGEALYRVPGSGRATITALNGNGTPQVVPAFEPGPASWRVVIDASRPSRLELRVSDVPGWHASIDNKPLALSRWKSAMLSAEVPPGRHVVTLDYRPVLFDLGLLLAGIAALALVSLIALERSPAIRAKSSSP